jgi:PAS domain S-box-containing protein
VSIKARPRGVASFEQNVRELSESLDAARARTAKLTGPTSDLDQQDPAMLREALEELRVHQEELAVANEELRAQLDELGAASRRVHAERERYRKLFDLTPDSYFVTDSVGSIRDVNAAASRMLEIEARFLQGKPLAVLTEAADSRMLLEAISALRSKSSVELELRFNRRTSGPEWHTVKAVALAEESAILWFARSVHAEHEARVALAGANHEAKVAARSAHDADMARANRDMEDMLARERRLRIQLEQEHIAKDRFFSVLSHDLRAPINAVVGWTQLLRREPLDHAARDRALATIERSAFVQLRIVEELLDISRDGGNAQLEQAPVVLDEVVRQAVEDVVASARERGIELTTALGTERLVVAGDRRRLAHAIGHLLTNALQFTPHRDGRIVVELHHTKGEAHISVSDSGRGIAPSLLSQLSDPLRSVDYAAPSERVGLGLYVVHRLAQMHGGRLLAESEGPGRGARFTLVLPLADAYAPASAEPAEPVSTTARRGKSGALEGVRALVVDDEEDSRDLMAAILRHQGAIVTTAVDVESALAVFDAAPSDVVLSDIALPGRNGLELARELRGRAQGETVLVAVSGYAGAELIENALGAGFDFHMAKPIDPVELVELVGDAARLRMR